MVVPWNPQLAHRVVKALKEGKDSCEFWINPATIAGLDFVSLNPLAIPDHQNYHRKQWNGRSRVGRGYGAHNEGYCETGRYLGVPGGSRNLRLSASQLRESGYIDTDEEEVLLYNTGSGILYPNLILK